MLPDAYTFTGQRRDNNGSCAFLDYGARRYDPHSGRFISPDSIVPEPGNPQSLNRYAYAGNNPITYNDPTGHAQACADGDEGGGCGLGANEKYISDFFANYGKYPWFAQAYASMYAANQETARGSAIAAEAAQLTAESYLQQAKAFLPQRDWHEDLPLMADPGMVYQVGSAFTAGGVKAIRAFVAGIASTQGSKGGIGPVNQGKAGVVDTAELLQQQGYSIVDDEITVKSNQSGVRMRTDLVVKKDGAYICVECKTGPTAVLSRNQSSVLRDIPIHGGTFVGPKARGLGIEGRTTSDYIVIWWR